MYGCILPSLYSSRISKLGFTNYLKPLKLENGLIRSYSIRNGDAVPFQSDENLLKMEKENSKNDELKIDKPAKGLDSFAVAENGKRTVRRTNVIAKQVISIRSAISLGFVSQLWVNTSSWIVLVVEVRPNLLSGDFERFPLKAISRVGDVILIEDENVIENDFKFVGLDSLVGYTVVTPSRRSIGKVRGYIFNINSGAVECLEIDSFGIPLIPSNLVSTYALFVEDILEILSDTIVVHESAALYIQRLTKGLWDGHIIGNSFNEFDDQSDPSGQKANVEKGERRYKNLSSRKSRPKIRKRKTSDDWELPMDYF